MALRSGQIPVGVGIPTFVQAILVFVALEGFLGDEIVLHALSCMGLMKITVLNTKTLQEYRIRHNKVIEKTDVIITYNAVNHFNAAGTYG